MIVNVVQLSARKRKGCDGRACQAVASILCNGKPDYLGKSDRQ
jgi:hypothetical protein